MTSLNDSMGSTAASELHLIDGVFCGAGLGRLVTGYLPRSGTTHKFQAVQFDLGRRADFSAED